ncbi:MAG: F0F1 ATP synthase subunit B [Planctomycetaceae bacterium]
MHGLKRGATVALLVGFLLALPAGVSDSSLRADDAEPHAKTGDGKSSGEHDTSVPLSFKGDLAIWSLIVFILFVIVLRLFAWGPLTEGLNNREARIRDDIAAAEEGRRKAEQMLVEHRQKLDAVQDEVREIIAEARRDAEHTKNEIVAAAQKEAEASKTRSISEIERARDAALKELFDTMSTQVAAATEHVLGRSLSGEDQDRLIQDALSQFSQSS